MKQFLPYTLLLALLIVGSCKKTIDTPADNVTTDDPDNHESNGVTYPVNPQFNCQYSPNYGDSIVYAQPATGNDFIIQPKNNKGVSGAYYSWPAGLSLDSKTGNINLTKSETGQRYSIGFVLAGGKDTCMTAIIIAGASYMDSVYNLTVSNKSARPYFNANPGAPQPCGGPGCFFDWNNYAANQGIVVNMSSGYIDLKATMLNNVFGPKPVNGSSIFTTIYYALNDNSNYAHQQIGLHLMYYEHRSDIPQNILSTISTNISNTLSNSLLGKGPSTRPPLIVIVRDN